jgi:hypothetical protein
MPGGTFPSPDDMIRLHKKAAEQRKVEFETIVEAADGRRAHNLARGAAERFLDWLSFLLLEPVVMLEYHDVSGKDGGGATIGFRPSFEERSGERGLVTFSAYRPPRTLDIRRVASSTLPPLLPWALKWYRKGLIATEPEEAFSFTWSGLETLSEALASQAPKTVTCGNCGAEVQLAAVAKTGLLDHMRHNLGLTRKVFDRFFDVRSDIVHGKRELDEDFRDEVAFMLPGVRAVFVTTALLVLNGGGTSEGAVPPWFQHPVLGDVSDLCRVLKDTQGA